MKKSFFAFGVVALLLVGCADEGQGDIGVVATALTETVLVYQGFSSWVD